LTPEEYEALKASIAEHGVRVPIEVDEEGNILDGHNRAAIARELQIPCPTTVKSGLATPEEKRRYARELNCARRQMTPEKKRKIIEAQLIETPDLSNNWIAEIVGVQKNTVIAARADLEATCQIDKLDKLRSKDGKLRPAEQTKPERFPWLNGPDWQDWHRMEARHYLRQIGNEIEQDVLSEMVRTVGAGSIEGLKVLGGYTRQSSEKRKRILELWGTGEQRNRDRAINMASGLPRVPDPRIALLEGGYDYVSRAAKAFPEDPEAPEIRTIATQIRVMAKQIEEKGEE
jgi:ParB-like chromosome segregation protein Spo0J